MPYRGGYILAELLRDVFKGLRDYFQTNLTADRVVLGFRDERSEAAPERDYPEVTVTLYDARLDNVGRYGGLFRTIAVNPDGKTAKIGRIPSPLNLYFQLDTFCEKREDDWILSREAMGLLADRYTKITTDDGRVLHLFPVSMDVLDTLTADVIWRKAYRFFVQVWLDSPATAEDAYLVLIRRLKMEGEVWDMDSSPSVPSGGKIYANGEDLILEKALWAARNCSLIITYREMDQFVGRMKEANSRLRLLRYSRPVLISEESMEPFPGSVVPIGNLKTAHDDWFWKTEGGAYIHPANPPHQTERYLMDPAAGPNGFCDYWLTEFLKFADVGFYDGIMADLICIKISKMEQLYPGCSWKYPTQAEFEVVQEAFLAKLKEVLNGQGMILIPNSPNIDSPTDPDYLVNVWKDIIDGWNRQWFMMEAKNKPGDPFMAKATNERFMTISDSYSADGKLVIVQVSPRYMGQGFSEEQVRADILYCIRGYLLVKNDPWVCMAVDWNGSFAKMEALFNTFGDLFEYRYGNPVGDRFEEGGVWKRRFENGMIVKVDMTTPTSSFGPE